MSLALAALGEEDTQRMGESAMDSIAEKFMQSNGEVDLEDEPEEAPGLAPWVHRERLFRAQEICVLLRGITDCSSPSIP